MERLSRTRPRRPIPEVLRSARTVPAWPYRCEVTDHFAFDCVEPRSGDRLPPCEGHRAPPVFRRQVGFGRQPGSGRRLPTAATIFGDLLRGGMRHLASSSVICIGREPRRPDGPAAAEHQSGSRAGKGGHKPAGSRKGRRLARREAGADRVREAPERSVSASGSVRRSRDVGYHSATCDGPRRLRLLPSPRELKIKRLSADAFFSHGRRAF